jgi:membrane-bound serine protease (ClpP class)
MLAAMIGIYVEVNNPGLIIPGAIGVTAGVLFLISLQQVPFSWIGLIIMLLGIGFLVAEVFIASFGLLFASGIACFLLGGTMMFDTPDLSDLTVSFWDVLLPSVVAMSICAGVIVFAVGRSMLSGQVAGVDELIGLIGRTTTRLDPSGKVFVRGEYWSVDRDDLDTDPIDSGEAVEVIAVEGLRLRVRRARRSV